MSNRNEDEEVEKEKAMKRILELSDFFSSAQKGPLKRPERQQSLGDTKNVENLLAVGQSDLLNNKLAYAVIHAICSLAGNNVTY